MKKLTLFLLTALLLASVFAGCSASAYMDDTYAGGYSNVSTTRNGTVNGTNGRYAGYGYGSDANGTYTGPYRNGSYNGTYNAYPGTGTTRSTTTTTTGRTGSTNGTDSYTGTTSGTGMTGGR